ncbi:MAG: hypothetical protein LBN93_06130 [Candidatus Symbiothrix sp.]|jgi:predicted AAA+ superfamily ATPase|nr:hypothetical protein [Candidatus Symbiothrix sp.]
MEEKKYLNRICDDLLQQSLQSSGAVLIEGAKWCGKTSMAMKAAASSLFMQDPDKSKSYQNLADNVTAHTGTGRISRLLMRPMSLYESLESNGSVSLQDLFEGKTNIEAMSTLSIEQMAFVICRGGWPQSVKQKPGSALRMAANYVDAVINLDVQRVDGIEKNPEKVRVLLRSLARNIAVIVIAVTVTVVTIQK